MKIIDYFTSVNREHWLNQIKRSDWKAGQYLYELLRDERLKDLCGNNTRLLLLTEGEQLISFCTYAEHDDIPDETLKPWIGFVYTFPEYRGKRRMGKLLEHAYALAKADGYKCIYISTREEGLYEKYGCTFWKKMKDIYGEESSIFRLPIVSKDYSEILGQTVRGTVDRPIGSAHPKHPDMIYPVNYGYVDGLFAADGDEQDVYIFGVTEPIQTFTGKVIAVLHRLNDCEDKWIVGVDGAHPAREEIIQTISFQEQYFMGELITGIICG